jgi:hypothetical protein
MHKQGRLGWTLNAICGRAAKPKVDLCGTPFAFCSAQFSVHAFGSQIDTSGVVLTLKENPKQN